MGSAVTGQSSLSAEDAKLKSLQIQGPTQKNPFGAKYSQIKPSNAVIKEKEHMSSLAIELHGECSLSLLLTTVLMLHAVNTRGNLLPDPAQDPIQGVFYCLQHEHDQIVDNGRKDGTHCGFIVARMEATPDGSEIDFVKLGLSRYTIEVVEDEIDLVKALVDRVREWDPEILTGFDVLKDSWGYFVERVDDIGQHPSELQQAVTETLCSARAGHRHGA